MSARHSPSPPPQAFWRVAGWPFKARLATGWATNVSRARIYGFRTRARGESMTINSRLLEASSEALGRVGPTTGGARFQPAMIASGVMAGKIALEDAYNARDKDGIRLVDELERIGCLGAEPCVARPFRAYLELHIEQGPLLEEDGLAVGVVEGIVAISWSRLAIHGVQDHAGPTPMRIRHDALVAAADVVAGVRRIPRELGGDLVTTVGNLTVSPNIVNAIPGKGTLSIDMRDPRDETLDRALPRLDLLDRRSGKREGVG